jgi:hypothetical protein
MNAKHLTNYMKDHLAGSIAAVDLLDHLISSERGATHEQFFIRLRQEVVEDQEVLSGLLRDLHAHSGAVRNTAAFLSEKLARIKLSLEDRPAVNWHDLKKGSTCPGYRRQTSTLAVASCRSRNTNLTKSGFSQT